MTVESSRDKEVVQPGELYFLSHPGSEIFSGYGLTTEVGRKDRLTGLLMVDRPQPVDPSWLDNVEALYGDYQLVPMTASGERGILAQLRIEPESLPFLERFAHPVSTDLTHVLQPFMEQPPAPIFKLHWDADHAIWASDFWIGLPPEMQAVFEESGPGCFAALRDDGRAGFVSHASDTDIDRFHEAPVLWEWQLVRMPSAPLIRFQALILDNPYDPYMFEHFLNVNDPDQASILTQLVNQEGLSFDFFGNDYEYKYSKLLAHPAIQRDRLQRIVEEAIDYYGDIPPDERNFDRAKARFIGQTSQ